jgi:hypothetical protein
MEPEDAEGSQVDGTEEGKGDASMAHRDARGRDLDRACRRSGPRGRRPSAGEAPLLRGAGVFVGVVSLAIVMPVCLALFADRRLLRAERLVEDPEPVVQQSLVDRERGQEPDHVVVGPGLQDHESFTQAPLHDRVPVGAG